MTEVHKEWLNAKDFMEMSGFKEDWAQKRIREIKSVSDIGGCARCVLWEDYENWKAYRRQQSERKAAGQGR